MCIWFFIIYRMSTSVLMQLYDCCFFSSRRRHTICALVTGVQTCALPICARMRAFQAKGSLMNTDDSVRADRRRFLKGSALGAAAIPLPGAIGRASCRARVCPYVEISVGAVSIKKKTKYREKYIQLAYDHVTTKHIRSSQYTPSHIN